MSVGWGSAFPDYAMPPPLPGRTWVASRGAGWETRPKKAALWSLGVYRALNGVPCGNPGIQSPMQGPNLLEAVIHQNLGNPRR
jgi:hypothetical protein